MKIEIGGVTATLTIVFVILKLANVIDWEWCWVLSPLWIMAIFWALLLIIIGILAVVAKGVADGE